MIYSNKQARDLGFNPTVIINRKELRNKAIHLGFSELIMLGIKSLFIKK